MASVPISGSITLPTGASYAEIFAVNLVYGAATPRNCAYLGGSTGGSFNVSLDDTEITQPFWLLFEFYGDAAPAIEGPYNYDGSPGGGGP